MMNSANINETTLCPSPVYKQVLLAAAPHSSFLIYAYC